MTATEYHRSDVNERDLEIYEDAETENAWLYWLNMFGEYNEQQEKIILSPFREERVALLSWTVLCRICGHRHSLLHRRRLI